ncbi:MAG: hypothetical protein M3O34_12365 [Chloroflexota bacterium]|nr:hypothetical protein [Chloroflexota bacterium]
MRSQPRQEAEGADGSPVVASLTVPGAPRRVSAVEAAHRLDASTTTLRRRIRTGELAAERGVPHHDTGSVVALSEAQAERARPVGFSADGAPRVAEAEDSAGKDAAVPLGLALWCSMAAVAQQVAATAAGQQATLEQQAATIGALERENGRLIAELAGTQATIAAQAGEIARLGRYVLMLALVAAGLGALLIVLGTLAPGWVR